MYWPFCIFLANICSVPVIELLFWLLSMWVSKDLGPSNIVKKYYTWRINQLCEQITIVLTFLLVFRRDN